MEYKILNEVSRQKLGRYIKAANSNLEKINQTHKQLSDVTKTLDKAKNVIDKIGGKEEYDKLHNKLTNNIVKGTRKLYSRIKYRDLASDKESGKTWGGSPKVTGSGENENSLANYEKKLKAHDWTYEYSDDNSKYKSGLKNQTELEIMSKLSPEHKALFNKHRLFESVLKKYNHMKTSKYNDNFDTKKLKKKQNMPNSDNPFKFKKRKNLNEVLKKEEIKDEKSLKSVKTLTGQKKNIIDTEPTLRSLTGY